MNILFDTLARNIVIEVIDNYQSLCRIQALTELQILDPDNPILKGE